MNKGLWITVFLLALVALTGVFFTYFYWFKIELDYETSKNPEVWGQFGDFVGGLLNPILSFITVVILIITSLYQQNQYQHMEKREANKRFDDRFYGMISYQRDFSHEFKCRLPNGTDASLKELIVYIESIFFDTKNHAPLNNEAFRNSIFPLIRGFYILVKMINDSHKDKVSNDDTARYYEWLVNLSDYDLMRLVLFCIFYYEGISSFEYIKSNDKFINTLSKIGWESYINEIQKNKAQMMS
ncbi:hypothetical protein WEU31_07890 [Morganella morganii]|uniref:hypothetical protein n=1 Tax=Morganella morganii TaxID=582 RepID=UPI0030CF15A3